MRILIVQDSRAIGRLETEQLQSENHQVTWVTGFKDVDALLAITPEGSNITITTDYDFAIVDGEIDGPSGRAEALGPAVVKKLSSAGMTCIANSSQDQFNQVMMQAGASRSINQLVLFVYLVIAHLVKATDLLSSDEEAACLLNQGLRNLISESPGKDYCKAADAALSAS